ncbi:PREDICTED: pathogenesis-related protein STH-2-like [Erythranthe guttata]|uniref:pathogenesis-related protein STH-2-like n=1 Tax=Erythranthe guttata TaxID=4155 RepID=UPI00064DB2B9|nr:PREDICTED: pathogenesis-related protein STH-2-like [Erythranthe guttata]|eukprot:XP_012843117.1 PREDICTED: pathogenesis-related protein STH-2-like [Erythranthe guttata]
MGVKSFFEEVKAKVSPSRLFKALITESHDVIPKVTTSIKSVVTIEGDSLTPGCIRQTNFPEGNIVIIQLSSAQLKYVKHRIDAIDTENYVCKYTLVEGDILGDKLEKICYEIKFEASEEGCNIKLTSEYHTKGDFVINDEEIKAGKEQALGLYKACEEYLIANPHVCA